MTEICGVYIITECESATVLLQLFVVKIQVMTVLVLMPANFDFVLSPVSNGIFSLHCFFVPFILWNILGGDI